MRGGKGKLICVWSPVLHGEGCSTLADAIGFGLQLLTDKKVLIMNCSGYLSYMERFVERDIEIRYTLDNLKIFGERLQTEHIHTYATRINSNLFMIAGSRIDKTITREGKGFDSVLIDRCLEGFDVVVVDLSTGIREDNYQYLERADHIIAVITPNEIMLEELFSSQQHEAVRTCLLNRAKTTVILNKLYEDWALQEQISKFKRHFGFEQVLGVCYDGDALKACCQERNFYSYLYSGMKHSENMFIQQVAEVCEYLIERLNIEADAGLKQEKNTFISRLLKRKYSQFEVRA